MKARAAIWIYPALALLVPAAGGCAFMGDVFHAEGEYAHKIGDAIKREGARREAAKARAPKKAKAAPKAAQPPES